MLHVLPSANQTCLATYQVLAGCGKFLQSSFAFSATESVRDARFIGPRQTFFATRDINPGVYDVIP